jgi:hypothetical protein
MPVHAGAPIHFTRVQRLDATITLPISALNAALGCEFEARLYGCQVAVVGPHTQSISVGFGPLRGKNAYGRTGAPMRFGQSSAA